VRSIPSHPAVRQMALAPASNLSARCLAKEVCEWCIDMPCSTRRRLGLAYSLTRTSTKTLHSLDKSSHSAIHQSAATCG